MVCPVRVAGDKATDHPPQTQCDPTARNATKTNGVGVSVVLVVSQGLRETEKTPACRARATHRTDDTLPQPVQPSSSSSRTCDTPAEPWSGLHSRMAPQKRACIGVPPPVATSSTPWPETDRPAIPSRGKRSRPERADRTPGRSQRARTRRQRHAPSRSRGRCGRSARLA